MQVSSHSRQITDLPARTLFHSQPLSTITLTQRLVTSKPQRSFDWSDFGTDGRSDNPPAGAVILFFLTPRRARLPRLRGYQQVNPDISAVLVALCRHTTATQNSSSAFLDQRQETNRKRPNNPNCR